MTARTTSDSRTAVAVRAGNNMESMWTLRMDIKGRPSETPTASMLFKVNFIIQQRRTTGSVSKQSALYGGGFCFRGLFKPSHLLIDTGNQDRTISVLVPQMSHTGSSWIMAPPSPDSYTCIWCVLVVFAFCFSQNHLKVRQTSREHLREVKQEKLIRSFGFHR